MDENHHSNYRTETDAESIRHSFLDNLYFVQARFDGATEQYTDDSGRFRVRWQPQRLLKGVA